MCELEARRNKAMEKFVATSIHERAKHDRAERELERLDSELFVVAEQVKRICAAYKCFQVQLALGQNESVH